MLRDFRQLLRAAGWRRFDIGKQRVTLLKAITVKSGSFHCCRCCGQAVCSVWLKLFQDFSHMLAGGANVVVERHGSASFSGSKIFGLRR